jgi:hypothetical protein
MRTTDGILYEYLSFFLKGKSKRLSFIAIQARKSFYCHKERGRKKVFNSTYYEEGEGYLKSLLLGTRRREKRGVELPGGVGRAELCATTCFPNFSERFIVIFHRG